VIADSSVRLLAFDRDAFESVLGSLKDLLDKKANMRMLVSVPMISRLPPRERNAAYEMFTTKSFTSGEVIVHEGEPGTKFFLIKSGVCVVTRHSKLSTTVTPFEPSEPPPAVPALSTGVLRGERRAPTPESFDSTVESIDVRTMRRGPSLEDDVFVVELKVGDHFGEQALINNAPRNASVRIISWFQR
jgi:CRP-like cAMP-binding protein